jgi:uncharacterized protein DUF4342
MPEKGYGWQSFKVDGTAVIDRIKEIIREGNVRRVVVEHEGRTIAEFPLTVGVVGAVLAPVAAAIGALVALLKDCTIHVERVPEAPEAEADRVTTRSA